MPGRKRKLKTCHSTGWHTYTTISAEEKLYSLLHGWVVAKEHYGLDLLGKFLNGRD